MPVLIESIDYKEFKRGMVRSFTFEGIVPPGVNNVVISCNPLSDKVPLHVVVCERDNSEGRIYEAEPGSYLPWSKTEDTITILEDPKPKADFTQQRIGTVDQGTKEFRVRVRDEDSDADRILKFTLV